jgi:phosphate-selective porin OprO/OprP
MTIRAAYSLALAALLPCIAAAEPPASAPQTPDAQSPLTAPPASTTEGQPAPQPPAPPAAPAAPAAPAPPAKATDASRPKPPADGFWIQSESGDSRLRVGGYMQGDARLYLDDAQKLGADTFLLRRVRPQLQGTLARRFDFYVMTDFGGGTVSVQDAYLDARFASYFRVRAGKFRPPVGLERLQSGSNLLFVERALPTSIVPNRDVGLQIHGEVATGVLAWALSLQNGTTDGGSSDGDTNDSKEVAARLFAQPFKKSPGPLRGLGIGVSGQTGRQNAVTPAAYKTPGQLTFFSYASGVTIDGTRQRLSPQGYFYLGPFGILGEFALASSPLVKEDKSDPVLAVRGRVGSRAWQAAASFFLTGEKAGFSAVRPAKPFDPGEGQWGALELVARAHQLSVDAKAFDLGFADPGKSARQATAWAVGLNWYLNRNVKYVLNYEQTSFDGGAAAGDRPKERALFLRAQVLF